MLTINAERIGDLAVVACNGRVVREEDVFKLRDAVQTQASAAVIALDLTEIKAIGGAGVGMLSFLASWARKREIQLTLYSPSKPVVEALAHSGLSRELTIANFHEMVRLLKECEDTQPLAA